MKSFLSPFIPKTTVPSSPSPVEAQPQADFHPLTRVMARNDSPPEVKKNSSSIWSSLVKTTQEAQGKKKKNDAGNVKLSIHPVDPGDFQASCRLSVAFMPLF